MTLLKFLYSNFKGGFPGGSLVKNLPANAGDAEDMDLIPGSGGSPGNVVVIAYSLQMLRDDDYNFGG